MWKFIKRQPVRLWNFISFIWVEILGDVIDDNEYLSFIGKIIVVPIVGCMLIIMSITFIILSPFWLLITKDDGDF